MVTSPFPGMDPLLEADPRWGIFHGWFIRLLAEQCMGPARELGCDVDVERSVYGREPTGEVVLIGEPDLLAHEIASSASPAPEPHGVALAEPRAINEVVLDPDQMEKRKQEYIVVRESGEWPRALAVIELLSFANKKGSYAPKYREKRSRLLSSRTHFMEIDFLRAGKNPSRGLFPELPETPYFIFVARKTGPIPEEEIVVNDDVSRG